MLVAAVIIAGILTIRPMGLSGRGLAVVVLFVVNGAVLAVRLVPESAVPDRLVTVWLAFGVLAAAALIGTSRSGTSYLFAFFLVAFAGSRLDTRTALVLAASCSLLCGGVLYLQAEPGEYATTVVGLATGAAVLAAWPGEAGRRPRGRRSRRPNPPRRPRGPKPGRRYWRSGPGSPGTSTTYSPTRSPGSTCNWNWSTR